MNIWENICENTGLYFSPSYMRKIYISWPKFCFVISFSCAIISNLFFLSKSHFSPPLLDLSGYKFHLLWSSVFIRSIRGFYSHITRKHLFNTLEKFHLSETFLTVKLSTTETQRKKTFDVKNLTFQESLFCFKQNINMANISFSAKVH